jgi:hypothetical protein
MRGTREISQSLLEQRDLLLCGLQIVLKLLDIVLSLIHLAFQVLNEGVLGINKLVGLAEAVLHVKNSFLVLLRVFLSLLGGLKLVLELLVDFFKVG